MEKEEKTKKACLALFGESLRKLRSSAGYSQEALAERAEIDRSYLGAIERGENNVALINIVKIANALDIPPHQLLEVFTQPKDKK